MIPTLLFWISLWINYSADLRINEKFPVGVLEVRKAVVLEDWDGCKLEGLTPVDRARGSLAASCNSMHGEAQCNEASVLSS